MVSAYAAELGLPVVELDDEPRQLERLWSALAATGEPHPGLSFARWAEPTLVGGVLPTILANCPDIGSLLDRLHRYHPIFGPERLMLAKERGSASVWLESPGSGPAHPETIDAFFAILTWLTRRLTSSRGGPARVALRRVAPVDQRTYRDLFGNVQFAAEHDRCVFDAATVTMPIERADPTVLSMLEPYAERRVAEHDKAWAVRVAEVVATQLDGPPTLASISRGLAISPRALQARLAEEHTSFSAVLNAVQRERTLALLASSDMPVTSIAAAVGFSAPAALTRAVRRWTGLSPTEYRRQTSRT